MVHNSYHDLPKPLVLWPGPPFKEESDRLSFMSLSGLSDIRVKLIELRLSSNLPVKYEIYTTVNKYQTTLKHQDICTKL